MSAQVEKLRKQREQLEARIKQLEAKEKVQERKRDTRRKVLLGALLSEWMEKDEALRAKVFAHLERYLTRNVDRQVFGLSITKTESAREQSAA